jgi:ATP-dependent Clp protease ATP-binding subunit ClpB
VNFRNAVIIMTSNIGSQWILEHSSEDRAVLESQVMAALRQHFRPEFLNRVDDTIIFRSLGPVELDRIIGLQLEHLARLLRERRVTIDVTPEARGIVAHEGYDPSYGARPLKRAIQRLLQNPLSLSLLDGTIGEGDHVIVEAGEQGQLEFRRVERKADLPVQAAALNGPPT